MVVPQNGLWKPSIKGAYRGTSTPFIGKPIIMLNPSYPQNTQESKIVNNPVETMGVPSDDTHTNTIGKLMIVAYINLKVSRG